jgi:hypothetical protein
VSTEILPLDPCDVIPELIRSDPLTPSSPPLAVIIQISPLLFIVLYPLVIYKDPPENNELVPARRRMLPPSPLAPEPTVTKMDPP